MNLFQKMKRFITLVTCSLLIVVAVLGIVILPAYAKDSIDLFDCINKKDGNYLHPFEETKFISCSEGFSSERDCPICHLDPIHCPEGRTIYAPKVDACLLADEINNDNFFENVESRLDSELDLKPSPAITENNSSFPSEDFRIINQDTGQALYVKLGNVSSINYYRLGNKTTYYVSEKPRVDLRQPSGGAEEAWYFNAGKDGWGTPYFLLVSVVVGRDTNLGNYCLDREENKVSMYGCGSDGISRWYSADGYIWGLDKFGNSKINTYLTIANGVLTLQRKNTDKPGQRWRFEAPK